MKSKRTKACDITPKVRKQVNERDHKRCVVCGGRYGTQIAHIFVNRSQGGLGVKENLAVLCFTCHQKLDQGRYKESTVIRNYAESYLRNHYGEINKNELKFSKWGNQYEQKTSN